CVLGTPNPTPPTSSHISLPTAFNWRSTDALIGPKDDGTGIQGIKDPSVVFYDGVWHVFASTASEANGYSIVYMNFTDWSEAGNASFFYLNQAPFGTGYRAAPEIFYFTPQKLWYLIYQNNNSAYSTSTNISDPSLWTTPRTFYPSEPETVQENIGAGYWVDMWVICDDENCHLFSSDDNGHLYRSQTPKTSFPHNMTEPVIAMEDPNRLNLFEASNAYKYGDGQYLLLVECIGSDGHRFFRSWTMSDIAGPYTPLADTEADPFARSNNVVFNDDGTPWTVDISHGEMIRASHDENLLINPHNLQYLYQGDDPNNTAATYNAIPWRLALLTQTNPLLYGQCGSVSCRSVANPRKHHQPSLIVD
ncbi:hypothetical protein H0H81_010250, partial [Sphagnurus paluster]